MTGSDIAMLPYAAFRLVELAEDAVDRVRERP